MTTFELNALIGTILLFSSMVLITTLWALKE